MINHRPQQRSESLVRLTAVDEWLILSKRNFKFDLGDVLVFLPSDNRGNIDEGTNAFCWIAQRSAAGLKQEEDAAEATAVARVISSMLRQLLSYHNWTAFKLSNIWRF